MAKLVLKSENQVIGDMAAVILEKTPANDLNPGSILLGLLQAAAKEDYEQYYQMLQIVRNYNIDTTTGSDLDNRAFEYGLSRETSKAATGKIQILRESGFEKVSTTHYTGFRSRIAGDTELFVNDASSSLYGSSGTLILGRDTPNEEEVTYSVAPEDFTNYYKITLDSAMTNDHSLEETVILKQGSDIIISSGTVIVVPATGRSDEVVFRTTREVTILAGEDLVDDVDIQASEPGIKGNINVGAITGTTAFPTPPFTGARAYNDSAFSNGRDRETDTKLRNRIKSHIQGLSQSTKAGISSAINGLVDPDTAKRVVSSNIIIPDNVCDPVKIYIDDGTGFEPTFENQGQEVIIAEASGGEQRLQLDLFPLVKAQVESTNIEPYDMSTNGLTLQINVGAQSETITFFTNDFSIPEAATAEEIVSAINNSANLIEARTSQIGTQIVINAKADENEDIQVSGGTANAVDKLNFPTDKVSTFYLYKNDKLLSKDGETAFIESGNTAPYDFSGPDRDLLVIVDGKTTNIQTVTISESDFDSPAAAAQATAEEVATLINQQLAGATATATNGSVRITSNTELSSLSKIKINTSDANTILGFSTIQVEGKDQDYTLNPELGIIELTEPLIVNDLLTAGTRKTRAFLTASIAGDYTFAGGETLDIEIDGGSAQTITFTAGSNKSAQTVAAEINSQLNGGLAEVRTVGLLEYLEIRTNTLQESAGSIEILSSSTGNSIFEFDTDTLVSNIASHTAYQVAQNSGPYDFIEGHTLVVVLDNDPTGKTYVITMDYDSEVTSGASTTQFGASFLINIFLTDDEIKDFYAIFKSGDNTITGTVVSVENPSGNTYRYTYDTPPTNFEDFGIDDQASFTDMSEAANNGNFLITGAVVQNTVYAAVLDKDISNPSALTPSAGNRYLVSPDAATSIHPDDVLDKDIANPSALTPGAGDRYIVDEDANDVTLDDVLGLYTDSADPGVSETHGFRYIINGTGLNDWVGHDNEIAQYNGVGTPGWIFITPNDKDVVYDQDSDNFYQFSSGSGTWIQNDWGGSAGKIAEWNGFLWLITSALDGQVRNVTDESAKYQYSSLSNTWTQNDWGGNGNQIAEWTGSAWSFTSPATNDVVDVTDESETYQYDGSSWDVFQFWIEVTNSNGATESGSSGTGLIGQRRQISAYNSTSGAITLASALRATPSPSDEFVILPSTKENVVDFFNNTKVTSLSSRAFIELVEEAAKIQISSLEDGSDGYVQITGGRANDLLQFSTSVIQGLRAYAYYVGLVKLVHRTIYGDEADLVSFPGVGATGVKFKILAPTVQEIPVVIQVSLAEGISLSSVENEIKSAIISYINGLGVSEAVIKTEIEAAVIALEGISDAQVTTPSDNVDIAENELARTKASIINVETI